MSVSKEQLFLEDLMSLIADNALEAKKDKDRASGTPDYSYELGRLMAYHEIVSLIRDQAIVFDVEMRKLKDINPERDLL